MWNSPGLIEKLSPLNREKEYEPLVWSGHPSWVEYTFLWFISVVFSVRAGLVLWFGVCPVYRTGRIFRPKNCLEGDTSKYLQITGGLWKNKPQTSFGRN